MILSPNFHRIVATSAVFLFIFLMGVHQSLSETYRVYGVRSSDVLNIRSQPSTGAQKVGSIPPNGRGIQMLGTCSSGWCPIQYRDVLGWVSSQFLAREVSANTPYQVTGIANWDVLYIRSEPSTRGRKIGSIPPQGRGIWKLGPCKGNWCKINYRGTVGWSSMMYLIPDQSVVRPAPVQPSPPPVIRNPEPQPPAITVPVAPLPTPPLRQPDYQPPLPVVPPAPPPSPEMFEGLDVE